MRFTRLMPLALAATTFVAAACKSDNGTGPGPVTALVFIGTVQGSSGSLSGELTLNINGTTLTGTFKIVSPGSSTHALTGTYNQSTKAVSASGDGYNFAGTYDGTSKLDGTMSGTATGTFASSKDNSSIAFCGTYTGTDQGVWSFTVSGTSIHGSATSSKNGHVTVLDGTMSGSSITISLPGGGGTLASGTQNGNAVSGTWDTHAGDSGNWTGSKCS